MPNESKMILQRLIETVDENDRLKKELATAKAERDAANAQTVLAEGKVRLLERRGESPVPTKTRADWLREYAALPNAKAKAAFRRAHARELGLSK